MTQNSLQRPLVRAEHAGITTLQSTSEQPSIGGVSGGAEKAAAKERSERQRDKSRPNIAILITIANKNGWSKTTG